MLGPLSSATPADPALATYQAAPASQQGKWVANYLTGDQWGVMNETGSYPGQPWLWLFQLWYHMQPGWGNSANIDLIAIYMTGLATVLLLLIPFIPGLRDIPRWIPVHRLIWRDWNRRAGPGRGGSPPGVGVPTSSQGRRET